MNEDRGPGFATLAVHAGGQPDPTGATRLTPNQRKVSDADDGATGMPSSALEALGGTALRAGNPAVAALEERVATLEGGTAAIGVASGNAARLIAFHALLRPGDEFVAARPIDPGAVHQFTDAFASFGWSAQWADIDEVASFGGAITPRTKAIFVESIGDSGAVTDVAAVASVARRARVPLIADNSLATPFLCRPFDHGADIVFHSRTGFLGGRGDAAGGVIVDGGTFDWMEAGRYPLLSEPRPEHEGIVLGEGFGNSAFAVACRLLSLRDLGSALSPFDAFLILSGIETLPLRMQRHSENARAVAAWLSAHDRVKWVSYAGLPGDRHHNLARKYCPNGTGAVLTFGLDGGQEAAEALLSRLQIVSPDAAVGGARSGIFHAAATGRPRHDQKPAADVMRLSVGIEDKADIIADLDQALAAI